jgi:hypothetical protein
VGANRGDITLAPEDVHALLEKAGACWRSREKFRRLPPMTGAAFWRRATSDERGWFVSVVLGHRRLCGCYSCRADRSALQRAGEYVPPARMPDGWYTWPRVRALLLGEALP